MTCCEANLTRSTRYDSVKDHCGSCVVHVNSMAHRQAGVRSRPHTLGLFTKLSAAPDNATGE